MKKNPGRKEARQLAHAMSRRLPKSRHYRKGHRDTCVLVQGRKSR